MTAPSLLEVTDLVSPATINSSHAGDEWDCPAGRLCVSNAGAGVGISEGQCLCTEARP